MVWEVPLGEVVGIVPLEDDGCVTGVSVVTVPLAVVRSADVVVMLTEAVVTLMEAVVTLREAVVTTNVVLPSCEAVVTLLETVVEALPWVVAEEAVLEATSPTAEPRRHTHSTATRTCFIVISAPFLLFFLVLLLLLQFHSLATTLSHPSQQRESFWN